MRRPLRPLTFEAHPISPKAERYPHVASYFAAEGGRAVDAVNTGTDVAEDLARHLLPRARRAVLTSAPVTERAA